MRSKDILTLTEALGEKLIVRKMILTTVESCTGGLFSAQITNTPGSSIWFDRGFITYSNQSKIDCVKVKKNTIEKFGAVSQQTADEMALGAINNSQGNIALSITGIAGPKGGSQLKPIGTIFFGIAKKENIIFQQKAFFEGNREEIREKAVLFALNQLLTLTL
mgnify:CR=1 FL=1